MNEAPNADRPPPGPPAAPPIAYASPAMAKPVISFRGAVTTLVVGGAFLLLAITFIYIAAGLFRAYEEARSYRAMGTEALAVFTTVLAGLSFILGTAVTFMGLRGVRQRETA